MSNLGQLITNSNLASLRAETARSTYQINSAIDDLPSKIMREQIALEKFGVTYSKLKGDYERILGLQYYCIKNCKICETRMAPYFNSDGSKKKLKMKPEGWFGALLLSFIASSPFWMMLFLPSFGWKVFGLSVTFAIFLSILYLMFPKPPREYRLCTPNQIKEYFNYWEIEKTALKGYEEEGKPFIKKLNEIHSICGSGGSFDVEYDYEKMKRELKDLLS